ncbi:MAG: SocA family protein [Planctomycetes bacterium]|nr:SocA family protein [Planctomycetota bacterium]
MDEDKLEELSPLRGTDLYKAVQAVAILLRHADPRGKRDNYTRILKLLYLAERRCLQERSRPLLGDKISAMENGPVMSAVYDLILNRHFNSGVWNDFISQHRFDIKLDVDPGNDLLSPYEIRLLGEIAQENSGKDQWQLIYDCHKLPEWEKNDPDRTPSGPKAIPISIDDILEALQMADRKEALLAWAREQRSFGRLYSQTTA